MWEVNSDLGGAWRRQAISWTNVDKFLWRHMASSNSDELTPAVFS